MTHGTLGIAWIVRLPCKPIFLSIEHFKSQTEVQLKNWLLACFQVWKRKLIFEG